MSEGLSAFFEKKKIDRARFEAEQPELWAALAKEFETLGPAGFDQRKKFHINEWRLRFPLAKSE